MLKTYQLSETIFIKAFYIIHKKQLNSSFYCVKQKKDHYQKIIATALHASSIQFFVLGRCLSTSGKDSFSFGVDPFMSKLFLIISIQASSKNCKLIGKALHSTYTFFHPRQIYLCFIYWTGTFYSMLRNITIHGVFVVRSIVYNIRSSDMINNLFFFLCRRFFLHNENLLSRLLLAFYDNSCHD